MWNNFPLGNSEISHSVRCEMKFALHICEANILQRSYFTWALPNFTRRRRISLKKRCNLKNHFIWLFRYSSIVALRMFLTWKAKRKEKTKSIISNTIKAVNIMPSFWRFWGSKDIFSINTKHPNIFTNNITIPNIHNAKQILYFVGYFMFPKSLFRSTACVIILNVGLPRQCPRYSFESLPTK